MRYDLLCITYTVGAMAPGPITPWCGSASLPITHAWVVHRCVCRGGSGCAVYTVSHPYPQSLTSPTAVLGHARRRVAFPHHHPDHYYLSVTLYSCASLGPIPLTSPSRPIALVCSLNRRIQIIFIFRIRWPAISRGRRAESLFLEYYNKCTCKKVVFKFFCTGLCT